MKKERGKKKKSSLRFLRYKNLTQELARYGSEFTPKKAMISYGMIVLLAAIFGLLYKLHLPYIASIGIIGVGRDNREFFSFKEKGLISNPRITLTKDYKTLDFPSPMIAERGKTR